MERRRSNLRTDTVDGGGPDGKTRGPGRTPLTHHDKDVPSGAEAVRTDPWARALGVEFLEVSPGYARLGLPLQPHMLNFQGVPHGGVVFSLADMALGAASNSRGEPSVALSVTINYLAAVDATARLVAEARERKRGRRAAFYDITVSGPGGVVVATLQCVTHRLGGAPAERS